MSEQLHCWHCAAPLARSTTRCAACLTDLLHRDRQTVRFAVVGGQKLRRSPHRTVELVPEPSRPLNLVARHWRGDFPLDTAYWAMTFLLGLCMFLLPFWAGLAIDEVGIAPMSSRSAMLGYFVGAVLIAAVLPWQIVGTFRSARRWRRVSPRRGWALAAQILLVPYVLMVGLLVATLFAGGVGRFP